MADLPPLPPGFTLDSAPNIGRPVIRKGETPTPPTEQYHPITPRERHDLGLGSGIPAVVSGTGKPEVVGGDKTNYRPMSPEEKAANHLSPDAPWLMGSNGEFKLPDGFKPADDASKDAIQKQEASDGFDSLIQGVHKARSFITDADTPIIGNTATGLGYNILKHSPFSTDATKLQGVIDQEIRGNIFMKRIADLKAASDSPTGGTGIGRIMQAEIPLITGAIGTLDPGKLGREETLNSLLQIERSALRSKAINNGENPDDPQVQQKYGIPALPAYPGGEIPGGGSPSPGGPIANGGGGDLGPTLTPSGGQARAVIDPAKQALGAKIVGLLQKGADRNTIMGFAVGADPTLRADPKFRAWVDQALQYRAKYPKAAFPIDPGFYTKQVPLSTQEKVATDIGASAPGAFGINAANGVTAGNLGNITGNKQDVDRALAATAGQHPLASPLGTMAGGAAATVATEGALGGAGIGEGALRTGLADMLFGGAAGASNPNGNTLGNIVKGAVVAPLAGYAGSKIASGVGGAVKGVTDPTVGYVAKDVPLTLGQAVGGRLKAAEDRLSGVPIVGDAIKERRIEGFQKMNSAAFDHALKPIGGSAGGKYGEDAVLAAQDQVGDAFDKALKGKVASVDTPFITQAAAAKRAVQGLPPSVAKDVENHVDTAIKDYFDPQTLTISGENMQGLLRDLQQVKKSYQNDPAGHRVGKALDQVVSSIEGMFQRQAPEVMPAYSAAKQSFKRLSTVEDAVLRAKNESKNGLAVFTPAQLGMADRANTVTYNGKHAAAAGKGEYHSFQRKMQEVLPSKIPDSGTAGRIILPAAAIAAGSGGGELTGHETTGLTLGTLLAAAYSKTGQRALVAAALKRPGLARTAGAAIQKAAPAIGHGTGAAAVIRSNRG